MSWIWRLALTIDAWRAEWVWIEHGWRVKPLSEEVRRFGSLPFQFVRFLEGSGIVAVPPPPPPPRWATSQDQGQ